MTLKKIMQYKIPISILKLIVPVGNFLMIIIMLYAIYVFLGYNINILSIFFLLVSLGYAAYLIEHPFSLVFYSLHVYFLPISLILIRSYRYGAFYGTILSILGICLIGLTFILFHKYRITSTLDRYINEFMPFASLTFFLVLGTVLINPYDLSEVLINLLFIIFIPIFLFHSILNLNKKDRSIYLSKQLNCKYVKELNLIYKESFDKTFTGNDDDKELILYYFNRALNSFILGDFEDCFLNSFKIVFESRKGFTHIYKISDWKIKRPKYVKIRAAIAHSKKDEIFKTPEELENFRKNLHLEALNILKITKFEFMDHFKDVNTVINEFL